VEHAEHFGKNGRAADAPGKLLSWLACELVESGWRLKHVHRLIRDQRDVPAIVAQRRRRSAKDAQRAAVALPAAASGAERCATRSCS